MDWAEESPLLVRKKDIQINWGYIVVGILIYIIFVVASVVDFGYALYTYNVGLLSFDENVYQISVVKIIKDLWNNEERIYSFIVVIIFMVIPFIHILFLVLNTSFPKIQNYKYQSIWIFILSNISEFLNKLTFSILFAILLFINALYQNIDTIGLNVTSNEITVECDTSALLYCVIIIGSFIYTIVSKLNHIKWYFDENNPKLKDKDSIYPDILQNKNMPSLIDLKGKTVLRYYSSNPLSFVIFALTILNIVCIIFMLTDEYIEFEYIIPNNIELLINIQDQTRHVSIYN